MTTTPVLDKPALVKDLDAIRYSLAPKDAVIPAVTQPAQVKQRMRVLLVSTTVFPIPPAGYSGLEYLIWHLAVGLHRKGHQVSVVAPQGSQLPEGVELIATGLREPEESVFQKYRERIEKSEFDVISDHSWEKWSYMSNIGRSPSLPIVGTIHTSPTIYQTCPPTQYPCFVGLSDKHCRDIRLHLKCDARRCYNGVDTAFYSPDTAVQRDGRWLWLARYTPEKGCLQAINIARRLRVPLDCVGDTELVGDRAYVDRCRAATDGLAIRYIPGVPRDQVVRFMRERYAYLFPLQWEEPFGLSVIEAGLCGGLPVMTLARGAMLELVKDGVNGFVYESEDALVEGIRRGDEKKIKPEEARKWAEQFSVERFVSTYERLFLEVAGGYRW